MTLKIMLEDWRNFLRGSMARKAKTLKGMIWGIHLSVKESILTFVLYVIVKIAIVEFNVVLNYGTVWYASLPLAHFLLSRQKIEWFRRWRIWGLKLGFVFVRIWGQCARLLISEWVTAGETMLLDSGILRVALFGETIMVLDFGRCCLLL